MKKFNITTFAAAVAFVGGIAVLPASPALAQSGSRICGKITNFETNGSTAYYAYITEVRQKSSSYDDDCKTAKTTAQQLINKHGEQYLTWTDINKDTCEDVGLNFESTVVPRDMCQKMEANISYKAQKLKRDAASSLDPSHY
jgi:hypothetical protein